MLVMTCIMHTKPKLPFLDSVKHKEESWPVFLPIFGKTISLHIVMGFSEAAQTFSTCSD